VSFAISSEFLPVHRAIMDIAQGQNITSSCILFRIPTKNLCDCCFGRNRKQLALLALQ